MSRGRSLLAGLKWSNSLFSRQNQNSLSLVLQVLQQNWLSNLSSCLFKKRSKKRKKNVCTYLHMQTRSMHTLTHSRTYTHTHTHTHTVYCTCSRDPHWWLSKVLDRLGGGSDCPWVEGALKPVCPAPQHPVSLPRGQEIEPYSEAVCQHTLYGGTVEGTQQVHNHVTFPQQS